MDHRNLLGFAAIILSSAVLIHSLQSALAGPSGPNVSLGANPIENFSLFCNVNSQTLVPSDPNRDFIVTDIITGDDSSSYSPIPSNLTFNAGITMTVSPLQSHRFETGLKVPTNSTLDCQNGTSSSQYHFNVTVLGYYAHP
jgi:hypothetical protein